MNNTLEHINNIPARTWQWLDANDVSVDCNMPEFKAYNHEVIKEHNGNDYRFFPMDKAFDKFTPIDVLNYEGIDKSLKEHVKHNFNTGAFIEACEDKIISDPIFIDYDVDDKNPVLIDNNVIVAEENSEITVVMRYSSKNQGKYFHNGLTRLYAKAGSTINIIKIQMLSDESVHFDSNIAKLEDDAVVNYTEVDMGALYSVTNYRDDLYGFRSSGNVSSIYLGDKERKIDINYLINHYGKETKSSIKARGVLLDKSSKTFRGTIDFKKGSVKSKGREEEYTMLLSPYVINRSVPILLCTEEDVDGQHAASSGKTDEDKLFYLMCRGLSEKEAKTLIIEGEFNPIIDKIPLSNVKNEIFDCIRRKLEDE